MIKRSLYILLCLIHFGGICSHKSSKDDSSTDLADQMVSDQLINTAKQFTNHMIDT